MRWRNTHHYLFIKNQDEVVRDEKISALNFAIILLFVPCSRKSEYHIMAKVLFYSLAIGDKDDG